MKFSKFWLLIFLFLVFISGYTALIITTMPIQALTKNFQNHKKQEMNLSNYFSQKGKSVKSSDSSFKSLLAYNPQVLGTQSSSSSQAISPKPKPIKLLTKSAYTIAILGDSMVDALGEGLPQVTKELKAEFPYASFTMLNYGAASTNIEYALVRLTNNYSYLGKNITSLLSQSPDIIVIESFAYNHWENNASDLNRHWLTITKLIDTVKNYNPKTKIVLAATIAPFCPTYTDGSANLPPERKQSECETVKAYLQNMVNFARSEHYPLADAYSSSLKGNEGNPKYINQSDHIHPSEAGKLFFSQKLAEAIAQILD